RRQVPQAIVHQTIAIVRASTETHSAGQVSSGSVRNVDVHIGHTAVRVAVGNHGFPPQAESQRQTIRDLPRVVDEGSVNGVSPDRNGIPEVRRTGLSFTEQETGE